MPTLAYSAYGTQIRLGDGTPLAPLTITNATQASPIVITTSSPHGVADVSYGTVSGVNGNLAANGSWVLEAASPTTLRLRGTIGVSPYTSGGTLVIAGTFASIAELTNVADAGSRTDLVSVDAHDGNGYSSQIPTLKRTNQMRLDVNLVPDDPGHDATDGLLGLQTSGERRDWLLVFPPYPGTGYKSTGHLFGSVNYYTQNLPVNGAQQAQFMLAFDGSFTWT